MASSDLGPTPIILGIVVLAIAGGAAAYFMTSPGAPTPTAASGEATPPIDVTPPVEPSPQPVTTAVVTEDSVPDPITHPCVVASAQYDEAIKSGKTACTTDADCGCYQGGIGKSGCGGVLDQDSVEALATIAKEFHEMKCPLTTQCAAWECKPTCDGGQCRR